MAGSGAFQFRAEVYNVLNHTEFQDIDRTARFDPAGKQINPNFGTAIGIAHPDAAAADDSDVGEV